MKGTLKHMEAPLKHFDDHRCLSQSEESKCMLTHGKYSTKCEFWKNATRGDVRQEGGRSGGDGGKIEWK